MYIIFLYKVFQGIELKFALENVQCLYNRDFEYFTMPAGLLLHKIFKSLRDTLFILITKLISWNYELYLDFISAHFKAI